MFKFLNISCEQAHEICNKAQYKEATFTEKLMLNLHVLKCKICKMYLKQNSTITSICKQRSEDVKKRQETMSDKEKQELKEKLEGLC